MITIQFSVALDGLVDLYEKWGATKKEIAHALTLAAMERNPNLRSTVPVTSQAVHPSNSAPITEAIDEIRAADPPPAQAFRVSLPEKDIDSLIRFYRDGVMSAESLERSLFSSYPTFNSTGEGYPGVCERWRRVCAELKGDKSSIARQMRAMIISDF